ncbi:hypothetical protein B0H14DRAFT_2716890 [Mycena olivaceomarginata]|nr:hypothetical protein B0H14DRAFT_2716890 [Mycena olivaceomarginata]
MNAALLYVKTVREGCVAIWPDDGNGISCAVASSNGDLSGTVEKSCGQPLSAHYSHLESLLNSAPATLTLIRDRTQTLCRHTVSVHPGITATPIPTPAPSPSPSPSSTRPATYAEVMTDTATDPAAISASTPDSARTPTPPVSPNKAQGPDLIFRFDCHPFNSPPPPARRPHPSRLFTEIEKKSIVGNLQLTSVCWTTKGNLAFAFLCGGHFASGSIAEQSPELWKGGSWHNIVIHRVPLVNAGATTQEETISGARGWLQSSGVDAEVIPLMCSELDLASRETAALRVSLSSKKHADFLVQNRVLTLGSQCRVSHYIPKSKPPS